MERVRRRVTRRSSIADDRAAARPPEDQRRIQPRRAASDDDDIEHPDDRLQVGRHARDPSFGFRIGDRGCNFCYAALAVCERSGAPAPVTRSDNWC